LRDPPGVGGTVGPVLPPSFGTARLPVVGGGGRVGPVPVVGFIRP
jgi:hypothetical protein